MMKVIANSARLLNYLKYRHRRKLGSWSAGHQFSIVMLRESQGGMQFYTKCHQIRPPAKQIRGWNCNRSEFERTLSLMIFVLFFWIFFQGCISQANYGPLQPQLAMDAFGKHTPDKQQMFQDFIFNQSRWSQKNFKRF